MILGSYGSVISNPTVTPTRPLKWQTLDYDSIWTVTIDASGNLSADNALCEGIDSNDLPATAPQF